MSAPDISPEAVEMHVQDMLTMRCTAAAATLRALRAALDAAERERDELQSTFRVRWNADMRAIKRWQAAHPGKELTWPDHADLVVWLLAERDAASATGYARGVRDAAGVCRQRLISRSYGSHADAYEYAMNAILALLPATAPPPPPDALALLRRVVAWAEQSGAATDANWWAEAKQMVGGGDE